MFKKALTFYTRYFAVWVVAFGILAYSWPGAFIKLEKGMTVAFAVTIERLLPEFLRLKTGMNWFFALTMFGIGAVLEVADFKRIAQRPTIVLVGSAFRMNLPRRRTLAIEMGMQNAGLGTVLALNKDNFGEKAPLVALPAVIFVFICIITASAMAASWQRTTPGEPRT